MPIAQSTICENANHNILTAVLSSDRTLSHYQSRCTTADLQKPAFCYFTLAQHISMQLMQLVKAWLANRWLGSIKPTDNIFWALNPPRTEHPLNAQSYPAPFLEAHHHILPSSHSLPIVWSPDKSHIIPTSHVAFEEEKQYVRTPESDKK